MTITTISNSVGHGIKLGAGNYGLTLTVASAGAVHGSSYGVYGPSLSSAEALVNEGLITATEDGIFLDMPASLLNAGSIYGGDLGAVMLGYIPNGFHTGGKDYFTNTGRISGGTYGAYFMYVTASNSGTITGGKTGLRMQGDSLVNSGSISGGTIGIFANEGIVINTGSGHISSQGVGVFVAYDSGPTPVISNAGNIYGGNTGTYIKFGTLSNAGTIGAGTVGVWLTASNGSNSGLVYGTTIGVYLYGSADGPEQSFTNDVSGIIESDAGVGLSANNERYVLNMGVVAGKLAGAYIYDSSLTNFNIINGGSIGLAASDASVTDYSEIIGGSFAIEATGSFLLSLANTAILDGNVLDEAGTGVLMLGGDGSGTLGGFGTTIIGFSKIGFAADWTLQGNAAGLAAGQVINGFTTADFLILDGFAANTGSIGAGGLVLSNGHATETIDLATIPVISDLSISSNGVNTTIAFEQPPPVSIISTFDPATLTPGVNNIAKSLTIASTGYVAGIQTGFITQETITNYGNINNVNFFRYGTLFNFGTIDSSLGVFAYGLDYLTNAGTIIGTGSNGVGIDLNGLNTLYNSGKIISGATAVFSEFGDTIINTGIIAGNVVFNSTGQLDNSGDISGGPTFGVGGFEANVENSGTITGPDIGIAEPNGAGTITNTGTIAGGTYGVRLEGGTIINAGLIAGAAAAIFNADPDLYAAYFTLSLEVGPGASFAGAVYDQSNEGSLMLGGSTAGALDMGTSFSGLLNISFETGSDWRLEGATSDLAGGQIITGFSATDTIILDSFVVNPLDTAYVTGSGLHLTSTSGSHVTLDIAGSFTTADFIVTDPSGNTMIEAVCYLRGTSIATPAGEVPVESLNIGDAVITKFNGYRKIKWIGRQNFASRSDAKNVNQIPVRITAGALGGGLPRRDLFISPGHSMLIDGVLVLAKSLVNGITITQSQAAGEIHYYQIEFETHDCVLAEGAWSESYADTPDFRARFHNAAEFYALYPDHQEPQQQTLCAPRPLAGPALSAALSPLVRRVAAAPGRLHGYIDNIENATIGGWAWDEANPHLPVHLEILLGNRIIGRILACDYRPDLTAAFYGSGQCSFEYSSPLGLPPDAAHSLRIRRPQDGAELPKSNIFRANPAHSVAAAAPAASRSKSVKQPRPGNKPNHAANRPNLKKRPHGDAAVSVLPAKAHHQRAKPDPTGGHAQNPRQNIESVTHGSKPLQY